MHTKKSIYECLLFSEFASIVNGKRSNLKLRGTIKELKSIVRAIESSRTLRETLERDDVTIDEITTKIVEKNEAAQNFEKETGIRWLL